MNVIYGHLHDNETPSLGEKLWKAEPKGAEE